MTSPADSPIGVPYLGRTELTQYFGSSRRPKFQRERAYEPGSAALALAFVLLHVGV